MSGTYGTYTDMKKQPSSGGGPVSGDVPQAQNGGYFTGMQDFIQQLAALGAGYELTDDDILNLGNFQLQNALYQQALDDQYKQGYLEYLNHDLGLKGQQMAVAKQQLDFQQGPYWDWYTNEYFPAQQQMSKDQLSMSNNQVGISNNQLLQSQEATKQSQFDTTKAKDYALAQAYGTQAARLQEQMGKYAMWAQQGFINPPHTRPSPLSQPRGY